MEAKERQASSCDKLVAVAKERRCSEEPRLAERVARCRVATLLSRQLREQDDGEGRRSETSGRNGQSGGLRLLVRVSQSLRHRVRTERRTAYLDSSPWLPSSK